MAEAYSLGVAAEMPQAAQTVDRFHVMQLFSRATDKVRCRERRESEEKRAMLAGTKYVWLKRERELHVVPAVHADPLPDHARGPTLSPHPLPINPVVRYGFPCVWRQARGPPRR